MSELLNEFKTFASGVDGRFSELTGNVQRALKRLDGIEAEWTRRADGFGGEGFGAPKDLLSDLLASDDFARFKSSGFRGKIAMQLGGKSFLDLERKTTITSDSLGLSTPGVLNHERLPGVYGPGRRRVRVRDVFSAIPVTSSAIDWIKESSFTNAASPVAETVSKPESAIGFTAESVRIATVAHWLPISRQAFDDSPAVAQYCSTRLLDGLGRALDYELVAGDGTGQHLSGLSAEATAYQTSRNVAGDTRIDKLNHACAQLEDADYTPDFALLNPADWRAIQLTKEEGGGTNTGSYLLGGPQQDGGRTLWDCRIVTSTAITAGTFYVGDSLLAVILDRMNPVVEISSEHQDFFTKNLLAVRCEQRVGFAITRGDAFVYGSF